MDVNERLARHLSRTPDTSRAAFIAPNATLLGDVILGDDSSVWYGTIVRADINSIRIGRATNLQDGVIVHLSDDFGVSVGEFTTVGHRAILHACRVGNECLIGMGATVLDGAEIGDRCIIGANSLVPQGLKIPAGSLVYGNPARIARALDTSAQQRIRLWAEKYVQVARAHQNRR
jgi:carbonic anhydrase/acetyltransferase-like protein (isoleucine patch superfamily)